MNSRCKKTIVLAVIFVSLVVMGLNLISSACWEHTTYATCNADTAFTCTWKNDSWGGWCEEVNCWNLYTQTDCTNITTLARMGKNCTWQPGGTTYGCEKLSCWSMSGTNSNTCVNNSAKLNCEWSNYCYNTGAGTSNSNCWEKNTQSSCVNATGCAWGQCNEKGCWTYNTAQSCRAGKDPWNGKNCTWENNWCSSDGCWKYNTNETYCISNPSGLPCQWKWNSCQDKDCYSWDFTNSNTCVNNTLNLSCTWDGSFCTKKDCWSYNNQNTCQNHTNCLWKAYTSSGWCNEINCWIWDSYNGGNKTRCENNAYGLNCKWSGNPAGNLTNGWCYKDISTTSCTNITSEKTCMDTYYCWWQYNNWNNLSAGGRCSDPGGFAFISTNTSILNEWNHGCYIFDMNATDCNKVLGCNYTNNECTELNNAYGGNISSNGINCSYINSSALCNSIPALSSFCSWQNGTCEINKLSSMCRDKMTTPPEGASFCEDYNSYENEALCNQIAGAPWYMP